jgi:hypothetical protein
MDTANLISPEEHHMKVEEAERKIARKVIDDAIAAGHTIDVFDGEAVVVKRSTNADQLIAAMFSTDSDTLIIHKDGKRLGTVFFVYGNTGYDVIADYSMSLHDLLQGAGELSEQLESQVDV